MNVSSAAREQKLDHGNYSRFKIRRVFSKRLQSLSVDAKRGLEPELAVDVAAGVEKTVEIALLPFTLEDHGSSACPMRRS